ncbi:hypothetical protein HD554DRAFT_1043124 [Boletus coccyginus]|nr:hypothetical protein HD554DRAFT_1043124 [Boletus coccyginus]
MHHPSVVPQTPRHPEVLGTLIYTTNVFKEFEGLRRAGGRSNRETTQTQTSNPTSSGNGKTNWARGLSAHPRVHPRDVNARPCLCGIASVVSIFSSGGRMCRSKVRTTRMSDPSFKLHRPRGNPSMVHNIPLNIYTTSLHLVSRPTQSGLWNAADNPDEYKRPLIAPGSPFSSSSSHPSSFLCSSLHSARVPASRLLSMMLWHRRASHSVIVYMCQVFRRWLRISSTVRQQSPPLRQPTWRVERTIPASDLE